MPDDPSPPVTIDNGTFSSGVRAVTGAGRVVAGWTADQVLKVVFVILLIVVCVGAGAMGSAAFTFSREATAQAYRTGEGETERLRQLTVSLVDQANAHYAAERDKDRLHDLARDRLLVDDWAKVRESNAVLARSIDEMLRRSKVGLSEPPEDEVIPAPRAKVLVWP